VPPSRIASVTYLSQEKAALRLWPQAARLKVNHNTAEEVLAEKPDLIVTDTFTSPAMRALIAKSGARVVEVPPAEDFDAIRKATRQVAAAVGEVARGEALIARMDARLAALAATRPARPIRVAGWGGGGYVPGRGTLFDAILNVAGARNIVTTSDGFYDVESLLAARPDILAYGDDYSDTPSLRMDQNQHPVLMKFFAHRRITYPSALLGCGVPESAPAAAILRTALKAAMKYPGGVP
jgi:iron complex transport system substrate-binding protein